MTSVVCEKRKISSKIYILSFSVACIIIFWLYVLIEVSYPLREKYTTGSFSHEMYHSLKEKLFVGIVNGTMTFSDALSNNMSLILKEAVNSQCQYYEYILSGFSFMLIVSCFIIIGTVVLHRKFKELECCNNMSSIVAKRVKRVFNVLYSCTILNVVTNSLFIIFILFKYSNQISQNFLVEYLNSWPELMFTGNKTAISFYVIDSTIVNIIGFVHAIFDVFIITGFVVTFFWFVSMVCFGVLLFLIKYCGPN